MTNVIESRVTPSSSSGGEADESQLDETKVSMNKTAYPLRRLPNQNMARYSSCPHLAAANSRRFRGGQLDSAIFDSNDSLMQINSLTVEDDSASVLKCSRTHNLRDLSPGGSAQSSGSTPRILRRGLPTSLHKRTTSQEFDANPQNSDLVTPVIQVSEDCYDGDNSASYDYTWDSCEPDISLSNEDRLSPDEDGAELDYVDSDDADDAQERCQQWLQTLQITKLDRIKSRSQVHLPPIAK